MMGDYRVIIGHISCSWLLLQRADTNYGVALYKWIANQCIQKEVPQQNWSCLDCDYVSQSDSKYD